MTEGAEVKRRTAIAIVWMVVATSWGSLASFAIFAIQARLLDPFILGVFNLSQILFQLTATLVTSGFMDAVIQRRNLEDGLLDTVFWANLGLGSAAGVLIFALAGIYGFVLGVPDVVAPLRVLALCLPIEVLSAVHLALCLRNFGHRLIAVRTFATTIIGGSVAVGAALQGLGIWSLVLQAVITSILNAGLAWRAARWRPRWRFSWNHLSSVLPYCGAVMTTKVLWMMLTRVPDIVIGHFWGAAGVGIYRMGWRLIEMISNSILTPLGSVAMSTFSAISHDKQQLTSAYLRMLNVASIVIFPLLMGSGYLARDFVVLLFGPKWVDSTAIVQVLALMAVPQVLNCFVGPALSAVASMRNLTLVALIQVVLTSALILMAAPIGVIAICWAYVARTYLTVPIQQAALKRVIGVSVWQCFGEILVPALATLIMLGVLYGAETFQAFARANAFVRIPSAVSLGCVVYVIVLFLLDKRSVLAFGKLLFKTR